MGKKCRRWHSHHEKRGSILSGDFPGFSVMTRTLADRRYLLLRRPHHLTASEQAQLDQALGSPVGGALAAARTFLEDWYGFWTDEHGQRRSVADAQARDQAWCTNTTYQQVAALQQVIKAVDGARFEQLSHFLKHPIWEATNNGAEQVGRRFGQLQGPHYNLRSLSRLSTH